MAIEFPQIDPVALSIGPIDIRWYALSYLAGFLIGWYLLKKFLIVYPTKNTTAQHIDDLITWVVIGVILGGRLGYVLFYNTAYYMENPLEAFYVWSGGMAFHGGLIGVILAMLLFTLKNKIPFFELADRVAVVTPIGLFFGRMANFINGELVGRAWDGPWAMIFSKGDVARHPSQLYQASTEGIVLLTLMILLQNLKSVRERRGLLAGAFLTAYGTMRFFVEFTRAPDAHLGFITYGLSMGQILCIPMVLIGLTIIFTANQRHAKT